MRSVFSVTDVKDVELGREGPPGHRGAAGWRAVTRVLRSPQAWHKAARTAASELAADLASTFFPSDCRLCGAAFAELAPARVCRACLSRAIASRPNYTLCTRCGEAIAPESVRFAAALGMTECATCRLAPPAFTRAVSHTPYDAEARELLHLLKFEGQRALAEYVLGGWLAAAILQLDEQMSKEATIIPVPLFAARERKRGFNQSLLLAQSAIKHLRRDTPSLKLTLDTLSLARVKDTHALFTQSPHDRRAGLRGAFRVTDKSSIAGREILLVDDIMTTGATARECSRVLLAAGAAKVWVATVARAQLDEPAALHEAIPWRPPDVVHPDPSKAQTF